MRTCKYCLQLATILQLVAIAVAMTGCSALDPRAPSSYSLSAYREGTSVTLTYQGPTPFFVEPHASLDLTSRTLSAQLGTDAKPATSMLTTIGTAVAGIWAGWWAKGKSVPK